MVPNLHSSGGGALADRANIETRVPPASGPIEGEISLIGVSVKYVTTPAFSFPSCLPTPKLTTPSVWLRSSQDNIADDMIVPSNITPSSDKHTDIAALKCLPRIWNG